MKQVNPRALKALREQKSWSKAELSKKSGIKTRRLIELENENADFHTIREGSFEGLCYALGATEDQLLGKEPISDPLSVKFVSLQSKITTVAQMNYDLINMVYGLSSDQLVQMAPLMFAILAEDSFVWRKEQLELRKQIQELKKQVWESLNDPDPDASDGNIEEDLRHEEAAIAKREVFSRPWWAPEDKTPEESPMSDRFTDFIAAKVNASDVSIRADLILEYFKGRDIRDPDTKYIVEFYLLEALTAAADVEFAAQVRLAFMSGTIRLPHLFQDLSDEQIRMVFRDVPAGRAGEQVAKLFESDVLPRVAELHHLYAPEVYRFDTETEGLGLDEMGFPIRVRRHPNATSETQSEDQGDENEPA
jgi:transcriptional regulator with XRE-family HTH domain